MSDLISQNLNMIFKTPKGETVHALKDLNFKLKKGELLTVLGPSGCGKTTLLNIAAGFLRPTSGNITLNGKEIDGPGVERGMVFQQGALFEWLTVAENVNFGLRMKKKDPIETSKKVDDWLEIVGLKGFGNTPTYQLSGGMQQRVGLARALAADPEFLLMDEPFSALDPLIRRQLQSEFIKLSKQMKKTTVFITHDLDEAVRVGHRIAIMRDGKVIQIGTPEQIVVNPADEYVADFVKGISRLKVVQAKTIMQSVESYENSNGKLEENLQSVDEHELLSKLIEVSKSKNKPLVVKNNKKKNIGVITQSDLLKAVIEGGDGE